MLRKIEPLFWSPNLPGLTSPRFSAAQKLKRCRPCGPHMWLHIEDADHLINFFRAGGYSKYEPTTYLAGMSPTNFSGKFWASKSDKPRIRAPGSNISSACGQSKWRQNLPNCSFRTFPRFFVGIHSFVYILEFCMYTVRIHVIHICADSAFSKTTFRGLSWWFCGCWLMRVLLQHVTMIVHRCAVLKAMFGQASSLQVQVCTFFLTTYVWTVSCNLYVQLLPRANVLGLLLGQTLREAPAKKTVQSLTNLNILSLAKLPGILQSQGVVDMVCRHGLILSYIFMWPRGGREVLSALLCSDPWQVELRLTMF